MRQPMVKTYNKENISKKKSLFKSKENIKIHN